jgi:hypothetical protein
MIWPKYDSVLRDWPYLPNTLRMMLGKHLLVDIAHTHMLGRPFSGIREGANTVLGSTLGFWRVSFKLRISMEAG